MEPINAGDASMARRPKVKNSMPMRLSEEAIRLARIASGYTGESMAEYISRITCERSLEDIEKLHQQLKEEKPAEVKPEAEDDHSLPPTPRPKRSKNPPGDS